MLDQQIRRRPDRLESHLRALRGVEQAVGAIGGAQDPEEREL